MVEGQPRQLSSTSHKIFEVEVDQLRCYFTKILEFSKDEMDEVKGQWKMVAVPAWSLVPTDWIMKDFNIKSKLPINKIEVFSLAKDQPLFYFKSKERDTIFSRWPMGYHWPSNLGCQILCPGPTS